jgi:hypothetical protein
VWGYAAPLRVALLFFIASGRTFREGSAARIKSKGEVEQAGKFRGKKLWFRKGGKILTAGVKRSYWGASRIRKKPYAKPFA